MEMKTLMNQTMIDLNDLPIESSSEDILGFDELASAISNQIVNISHVEGAVFSIHGKWGSGKSSIINLVKENIIRYDRSKKIKVSEFQCWWLKDEEKLRIEFLNHLLDQIDTPAHKEVKELFQKLRSRLVQISKTEILNYLSQIPGFGATIARIANELVGTETTNSTEEHDSTESLYKKLRDEMRERSAKKYLIIIDDIDRLLPNQILTIFSLIKTIGRLPNVCFLTAYDPKIVGGLIEQTFPSEGVHFLEKIVQIGIEIPTPSQELLRGELLNQLKSISNKFNFKEGSESIRVFDLLVLPNIGTLRNLTKLANVIKTTWPIVQKDAVASDFLAIQSFKLFQPQIVPNLRTLKNRITDETGIETNIEELIKYIETALFETYKCNRLDIELFKVGLTLLFPRIDKILKKKPSILNEKFAVGTIMHTGVSSYFYFDLYFDLKTPSQFKSYLIERLIENCTNFAEVDTIFKDISIIDNIEHNSFRIDNFLIELRNHSNTISSEGFENIVLGLTSNYSNLLKTLKYAQTREFSPQLIVYVIQILRNLFKNRIEENAKSNLIYKNLMNAELDCLVDFSVFIHNQYDEEASEIIDEFFPLTKEDYVNLNKFTVKKIEEVMSKNEIYKYENFVVILYWWDRLAGNQNFENSKMFCAERIGYKEFILKCAKSFPTVRFTIDPNTVEKTSQTESSSEITIIVPKSQMETILDFEKLMENADKLKLNKTCSSEEIETLDKFLKAERI